MFEKSWQWPDGTSNVPSVVVVESYDCPYPDGEDELFENGQYLVFGMCFFVLLLAVTVTFFIWRKWWRVSIEPLQTEYL
jgi:hypothetical protein